MSHPATGGAAEDLAAAAAARRHHAQLAAEINERTEDLLRLTDGQYLLKAEQARRDLLAYLRTELVPHALAEERTLYPVAAAHLGGALLVEGMVGEHAVIQALVEELQTAGSVVRAAAAARALAAVLVTHVAKENELILPLLVGAPEVSLAGLLGDVHELLGEHAHAAGHGHDHADGPAESGGAAASGCGCGGCGCGGDRAAGTSAEAPVLSVDARLDVRDVPHSERHALVLSTVRALPPGGAVVLVASHAPRPVLAEIDAGFRGAVRAEWLQDGPEVWQVRLERAAVDAVTQPA